MEKILNVKLNRTNYEYDVNAIIKAFYPECQVRVLTPDSKTACEGEHIILVELRERGAMISIEGKEYTWEYAETSGGAFDAGEDGSAEKKVTECGAGEDGSAEEKVTECGAGEGGNAEEKVTECGAGEDGGQDNYKKETYKKGFKSFLYRTLEQHTGHGLPWGNLTGIRPTKIAYGMLEEGKSREEIIQYMRCNFFVSEEKAKLSEEIARRERELLSGIHYNEGYSMYIGIPFCPTTCLYCSFTSFPIAAYRKQTEAYLDCLLREMEFVAKQYAGKILDCVYIGGGTPTTLEPSQLDRLLSHLKQWFDFSTVKEFTVEAGRADSITEEKLQTLYRHGVSRISVNPQTMKQETLDAIGRKASVEQVEAAFASARRTGFDNINMDIILGLPKEDAEDVQHTIDRITELNPDSLTVHSLAVKRASKLNQWVQENGISMLRNTDETMRIAAEGAARMGMAPYYLYRQKNMSGNFENVGYAKPGKLGLYNILIMEEVQDIVALGAGSITKRVYPDGRIERCENVKEVRQYLERIDEMIERKRVLLGND